MYLLLCEKEQECAFVNLASEVKIFLCLKGAAFVAGGGGMFFDGSISFYNLLEGSLNLDLKLFIFKFFWQECSLIFFICNITDNVSSSCKHDISNIIVLIKTSSS